ncbi:MAG: UbiA prenyltransferase family protein [Clostridia bacterium]|nr:UbiA prenyltransferase family protein [Clostridia bacterium]
MANFCTTCGKPIAACICNQNKNLQENGGQPPVFDPNPGYPPIPGGSTQGGTTQGGTTQSGTTQSGTTTGFGGITVDTDKLKATFVDKRVSFKEYLGLDEAEMTDNSDPYERGLNIVPDIIKPCDGEVPIKQFNVGKFRSFFSFKWAEARIQVTNKRVIFRCSGKSPLGKDFTQAEHSIDELIGLNFSKGVRFSLLTFAIVLLINLVIGGICSAISFGLCEGLDTNIVSSLIGFAGFVGLFAAMIFLKKKYFYNSMISAAAFGLNLGAVTDSSNDFFHGLSVILTIVTVLILLYYMIKVSLKPSASLTFTTRNASKDIMGMFSPRIAKANIAAEVLPACDTETAFAEISAIINDVQKMGDYAIEKWKK